MAADQAQRRVSRFGPRLVLHLIWVWGPAVALMVAIYLVSGLQDPGRLPGGLSDKAGHFGAYALLGAAVLRATAGAAWRGVSRRATLAAWLICLLYGASDEWHQRFVPGRTAAVDDWVADIAGAGLAIVVLRMVAGVVRRRTV